MRVGILLTILLCLLGPGVLAADELVRKPATNGSLARMNLDHSLARALRASNAQPNDPGAARSYTDLLLTRLQFYRDYADLDELTSLCDRWKNDARSDAQYLCADVAAARHDFVAALARIRLASKRDGSCAAARRRISAIAATLQIDPGFDAEPTPVNECSSSGLTYQGEVLEAAQATARGDESAAVAHYIQAVASYNDVSPYPIAWAWYQVAELIKEQDPDRAVGYYAAALEYLPDYIAPRVELAALQISLRRFDEAIENLRYAGERTRDPDINALLATALASGSSNRQEEASGELKIAQHRFSDLLAKHPYAFADHAHEVYASTQPQQANELAAMLAEQKNAVAAELAQAVRTVRVGGCATETSRLGGLAR